ncbi:MAG TPA: aldo/keto reductase [Ktedonobacterales bacterium]|jgi:aryl-alcohol dehydrogenase-like predicted oxidoreductase
MQSGIIAQYRTLGQSNLNVFPLCFGGNIFGWTVDEQQSFAVLDAYVAGGGNFIDTADTYSTWVEGHKGGESETIIGRWMKARGNRDQLVIVTKVGGKMGSGAQGLSRLHILASIEDSLHHLQTDHVDVYLEHHDDPNAPLEETLAAFDTIVRQGKARTVGASNLSAERLANSLKISEQHSYIGYTSLQPRYNLISRSDYERDMEQIAAQHNLGVFTYSSLASGFLSGKYRQGQAMPTSQRASGVQQRYMNEQGFAILAEVERVAKEHGATPAQVALAWILARPSVTAPIASATSVDQVHDLLGAVSLKLSKEDILVLDKVSAWQ